MSLGFQSTGDSHEAERSSIERDPLSSLESLSAVAFAAPRSGRNDRIHQSALEHFSEQERMVIMQRLDLLQALGKFVAKDFAIPVLLNEPGKGWHWNFVENLIRVDPEDLLHKPLDFLRFVVAHEGAHRRITRFDLIEESLIREPGYSFMSNAIEDPRINNFLVAAYERFGLCLDAVYGAEERARERSTELAQQQLGHTPRFMLAGLEYISRWYRELAQLNGHLTHELPPDVREVVEETLGAAQESWSYYPSADEVEASFEKVAEYQQQCHDINRDRIWPKFKTLVEADLQNQQVQEFLKELEQEMSGSGWGDFGPDTNHQTELEQHLSEEQLRELLEQMGEKSPGKPVALDGLSKELQQKLKELIDSLSEEQKKELREKAARSLKRFEGQLQQDMERLFDQMSSGSGGQPNAGFPFGGYGMGAPQGNSRNLQMPPSLVEPDEYSEEIVRPDGSDKRRYEQVRREGFREAQELEQELRRIFKERKNNRKDAAHRSGKNIHIGKRIREIAKDVSPLKSASWERKQAPLERDYAITLLVDQTGSMSGEKIHEAFKALVMMAEPLERLRVNFEILGFNSRLNVYKTFGESLNDPTKERLSGIEQEAKSNHANNTDDGWAIHLAVERLQRMNARRKFVIVCTDGASNPSPAHAHPFFDLDEVLARTELGSDIEVIGIGLGSHTSVDTHYNRGISGIDANELAAHLSKILQEIIENVPPR